jgi:hypothetical protein
VERLPEVGVLSHPEAVAADVDDVKVVEEAVDQGGGHDVIAEDLAPLLEVLFEVSTVEACSYLRLMSWKKCIAPVRETGR